MPTSTGIRPSAASLTERGTNVMVVNSVAGTVENNVETVFDFIVGEDAVTLFRTASPAILGYEMIEGPWNHRCPVQPKVAKSRVSLRVILRSPDLPRVSPPATSGAGGLLVLVSHTR
jgi:hypothetical protein